MNKKIINNQGLYVYNLDGARINITDLQAAIAEADSHMDARHTDPEFALLDARLHAYWKDLYDKLIALKKSLEN